MIITQKQSFDDSYHIKWRNEFLTTDAESINDVISGLQAAICTLRQMKADGIIGDFEYSTNDTIYYSTNDKMLAKKYGMRLGTPDFYYMK